MSFPHWWHFNNKQWLSDPHHDWFKCDKMQGIMRFFKKLFKSNKFLFFVYRLSSVFLVQTSYVPDEYWQSLEVAHKMVFGYGYLTWEWKRGLRSYLYPSAFAVLYQILKYFQLDTPAALVVVPRVAQAVLTAVSDDYFFHFCKNMGCRNVWIKVFILTNWFWYYCGSRTVVNMFETSLTIAALYYYPWNIAKLKFKKSDAQSSAQWSSVKTLSWKYLMIAALNCIIRPTAITIWLPLVLYQLFRLYPLRVKDFILTVVLPIAFILFAISTSIDQFWYGKFVFPPYNFFISNVYSGVASFYGSHPPHWYLSQGIPVILGLHLLPFLFGAYTVLKNIKKQQDKFERISSILFLITVINILVFSMIPHKEFRFILPLLPMMELIAIQATSASRKFKSGRKCSSILTTFLTIGFIIPSALFGIFHQKGTLNVMSYLAKSAVINPSNTSLLFLTPCHATPLYSHLHVNVSVRFLTCNPPITPDDLDESDNFFSEPITWLENNWSQLGNPSHVVLFDSLQKSVERFLKQKGFLLKERFLHTIFAGSSAGDNVLVYEH